MARRTCGYHVGNGIWNKERVTMTEKHLGGHFNTTHIDAGALNWAHNVLDCRSMIDIGCGPGGQVAEAIKCGFERVVGVDGDKAAIDYAIKHHATPKTGYICHDFSKDLALYPGLFDLMWCVEFLEHVYEAWLPNVFQVVKAADPVVIIATAASEQQAGGVHHVNCRRMSYWTGMFVKCGYEYSGYLTKQMREHSTMKREFLVQTGMVFVSKKATHIKTTEEG